MKPRILHPLDPANPLYTWLKFLVMLHEMLRFSNKAPTNFNSTISPTIEATDLSEMLKPL